MTAIKFYRTRDPYGEFSNFARYPVNIDGKMWPTTEHYFQAQKFAGTPYEEKIRKAKTPADAARMGRDRSKPLREDWEQWKIFYMWTALLAKFTQHKELNELLLSTEGAELIEHTKNDSYWGDGGDGTGLNILGKMLMTVRCQLSDPEWVEKHVLIP